MKLTNEHRVALNFGDEQVVFTLRNPSNKELNDFMASRWDIKRRGKLKDNTIEARAALFDKLLTGVENLEDTAGVPIGPDRPGEIPENWKSSVIFQLFEEVEIEEKN